MRFSKWTAYLNPLQLASLTLLHSGERECARINPNLFSFILTNDLEYLLSPFLWPFFKETIQFYLRLSVFLNISITSFWKCFASNNNRNIWINSFALLFVILKCHVSVMEIDLEMTRPVFMTFDKNKTAAVELQAVYSMLWIYNRVLFCFCPIMINLNYIKLTFIIIHYFSHRFSKFFVGWAEDCVSVWDVIVLLNVGRGEHLVSRDTPIDPHYSVYLETTEVFLSHGHCFIVPCPNWAYFLHYINSC